MAEEGIVTNLQMQTYVILRDLRRRIDKKGREYGWPVSVYTTPEHLWGYALVTSAYKEEPEESRGKILRQAEKCFPDASRKALLKVLG